MNVASFYKSIDYLIGAQLCKGAILDYDGLLQPYYSQISNLGCTLTTYDPNKLYELANTPFDTIICSIPQGQYSTLNAMLIDSSMLLQPTGTAYFIVSENVHTITEDNRLTHSIDKHISIDFPGLNIFNHGEGAIYAYTHYNAFKPQQQANCPFCTPTQQHRLIAESHTSFAIYDNYPVSPGHALIIPKQHLANYFDLPWCYQSDCWQLLQRVQGILQHKHRPDGYNVGINVQEAAGQSVAHIHIHLIPRYQGDVAQPLGGVRGVIPHMQQYKVV